MTYAEEAAAVFLGALSGPGGTGNYALAVELVREVIDRCAQEAENPACRRHPNVAACVHANCNQMRDAARRVRVLAEERP